MAAARKNIARVKKARDDALRLVGDGRFEQAVELYAELTRLEPEEGDWPRRAADCYWHLKKPEQRLHYSVLAATAYSEAGLLLKAIAMCKVALSVDPHHKETQAQLAQLHARGPRAPLPPPEPAPVRQRGVRPVPARRAAPEPVKAPAPPATREEPAEEQKRHQAQKARARLAAAAALRQFRAQRQLEEETPEARRPTHPGNEKSPSADEERAASVLGRVALKARTVRERFIEVPVEWPKAPASDEIEPPAPSLRLGVPQSEPHPALESLRLSERVPNRPIPTLPPSGGNAYSLTLEESAVSAQELPLIVLPPDSPRPVDTLQNPAPLFPEAELQDQYAPETEHEPEHEPEPEPQSEPEPEPSDAPSTERDGPPPEEIEARTRAALERSRLFSDLDSDLLQMLIDELAVVELETDEVLFKEGDTADAMYVIVEGAVVATAGQRTGESIELAHLEPGDFFGEIGLLSDQPRQAEVRSTEPTRLLRFDRASIGRLMDINPEFLAILLQFLKTRLVEDLTMTSPLFAPFVAEERATLVDQFEFLEIERDTVLLDHGQRPIGMYILLTGSALLANPKGTRGALRRLGPGDIFGEQALLRNDVSAVQVRTTSKCFALCLPSDCFREVIMTHPTILEYLSTLGEEQSERQLPSNFLDHMTFF